MMQNTHVNFHIRVNCITKLMTRSKINVSHEATIEQRMVKFYVRGRFFVPMFITHFLQVVSTVIMVRCVMGKKCHLHNDVV
jgi:hypothetical protein